MASKRIQYKAGYKYQLTEKCLYQTPFHPSAAARLPFIDLLRCGALIFYPGYCWDGPTWCPDFPWAMRASLIHDGLYQLIREGLLDPGAKPAVDSIFRDVCLEDGALKWQATVVSMAVETFGGYAIDPASRRPVLTAPPE